MKKVYVAPEMLAQDCVLEQILAGSPDDGEIDIIGGGSGGDFADEGDGQD